MGETVLAIAIDDERIAVPLEVALQQAAGQVVGAVLAIGGEGRIVFDFALIPQIFINDGEARKVLLDTGKTTTRGSKIP